MQVSKKLLELREQAAIGRNQWAKASGLITVLGFIALLGLPGDATAEHGGGNGRPTVDAGLAAYVPAAEVSGSLTIAGSDTMQPLMTRLASEFRRYYPDTKIAVQGGGSDSAMEAFLQGIAASRRGDGNYRGHLGSNRPMILASSRPLTQHEREEARSAHGHEPLEIPIALDAVAIYVHRDNPLQGLMLEQVDAIFGTSRKRGLQQDITTWGQVGLADGWEQKPIHLYGRDKRSGTRTFFQHVALMDGELKGEVKEEPGSASEILAIARDPFGIGYAGIGFQASMVRAVPLAEAVGKPFVAASAEAAANGTYPLRRYLYLYVNVNKAPNTELKPVIQEFLKFVNSREGQGTAVKAGVYPLPLPEVAKNLQALTGAATATTAITATMN
ncbi:MAG: PstS family phosphate ABC transporter substrate-binding protein [Candidatus Binatia bacterium]